MVKGDRGNHFALKGGDAQRADGLKTLYDGPRPQPAYDVMKKQGAIILGIGGAMRALTRSSLDQARASSATAL